MFGIDSSELVLIGVVALLVIGPKDLPRVMRTVGHWVGRARGMARHVRAGFDTMVHEAEIEEMNRRWQAENRAIMAAAQGLPAPEMQGSPGATADVALSQAPVWHTEPPIGDETLETYGAHGAHEDAHTANPPVGPAPRGS